MCRNVHISILACWFVGELSSYRYHWFSRDGRWSEHDRSTNNWIQVALFSRSVGNSHIRLSRTLPRYWHVQLALQLAKYPLPLLQLTFYPGPPVSEVTTPTKVSLLFTYSFNIIYLFILFITVCQKSQCRQSHVSKYQDSGRTVR